MTRSRVILCEDTTPFPFEWEFRSWVYYRHVDLILGVISVFFSVLMLISW